MEENTKIEVFVISIPDEVLVVVFKFLHTRYLMSTISLVSPEFRKLVESDFMYQKHHLKCLGLHSISDDDTNLRNNNDKFSWKEYTKMKWETRIQWINVLESFRDTTSKRECPNSTSKFFHVSRNKRRITLTSVEKNSDNAYIPTTRSVFPSVIKNEVIWKVRMRRVFPKTETYWRRYWIGLLSNECSEAPPRRRRGYFFDPRDGGYCINDSCESRGRNLVPGVSCLKKFDKEGNVDVKVTLLLEEVEKNKKKTKVAVVRFEVDDIINELEILPLDMSLSYFLCVYADYRSSISEFQLISFKE